jgi:hypothetical protein
MVMEMIPVSMKMSMDDKIGIEMRNVVEMIAVRMKMIGVSTKMNMNVTEARMVVEMMAVRVKRGMVVMNQMKITR